MTASESIFASLVAELEESGLESGPFVALAGTLAAGESPDGKNRLTGTVSAPSSVEVPALPERGSDQRAALAARGRDAIARGEVGVVVLGGGMATRFGGAVKALVPAIGGRTFLDVKLTDVVRQRSRTGGRIPFACMTSFATDPAIRDRLALADDCESFVQFDAPRLEANGSLFRDSSGAISRYATGHGDLTFALRRHGVVARFQERGVRTILVSNVDNLTATLDEAVIGAHLEGGGAITVEVAPKHEGDKGGAPAHVDGTLQIVESFRFPDSFDQDSVPVFNTNTLVLDVASIDRDFALTWFAVKKSVEGRAAYQLERLVGELTAFLPSRYLLVARDGDDARFQPVKEVDDLPRQAPMIERALRSRDSMD